MTNPHTLSLKIFSTAGALLLICMALWPAVAAANLSNTRADASGTLELAGASWLWGGGVDVYSNGNSATNSSGNNYSGSTLLGEKWQCVEMVNRLYFTKGWISSTWYGNGNQLYNNAPSGLIKESQGSITSLSSGDVISLDDGGAGHAAIINAVGGSTVQIVNQNTPAVYSAATYNATAKTITMVGWGAYSVVGVIHVPSTGGGGGIAGILRQPSAIEDSSTGRNIFYVGADNYIWQWTVQSGAWTNTRLTAASGAEPVAPGTSPSAVMDSSTGRNVFYVGADNAIWQWSVQSGQWVNNRLGGSVKANASPSVVVDSSTGRNVFYVDSGGSLKQWSVQSGWVNNTLGGIVKDGTSPTSVLDPTTGRNVFYVGTDSKVSQFWVPPGSGWTNYPLNGTGGNQTVASGTSPTSIYNNSTGRNVFYTGSDNYIYQWSVQSGSWNNYKLVGSGGTTTVASGSSPQALYDSASGNYIYYVGSNNQIWEWSVQSGWSNFQLTGTGSQTAADGLTSPGGVFQSSTGRNIYYFNNVNIWSWQVQSGAWNNFQL